MNKNDINEIFEAVGGKRGLIKWAKKNAANLAQLYSMLGKSVLQDGVGDVASHKPDDPERLSAMALQAMEGIIAARQRGDVSPAALTYKPGHQGINDAGAANPDVNIRPGAHGNSQTPEVPARVGQLTPQISNPKSDSVPSQSSNPASRRDKPQHSEPIVPGAGYAQAMGEGSPPDYGRGWSQTRYWGS